MISEWGVTPLFYCNERGSPVFFSFFASPPQVIKQSLFLFVLPTAEGLSLASWGLNGTGFLSFLRDAAHAMSQVSQLLFHLKWGAGEENSIGRGGIASGEQRASASFPLLFKVISSAYTCFNSSYSTHSRPGASKTCTTPTRPAKEIKKKTIPLATDGMATGRQGCFPREWG